MLNCTISGQVLDTGGNPLANGTITFNSIVAQTVQSVVVSPKFVTTKTDASGNMTAISLPQTLLVQITLGRAGGVSAPFSAFIPAATSITFGQLVQGVTIGGQAGFPLTADVSAAGFHIQNLAAPASTGDALSEGHNIGSITPASATFLQVFSQNLVQIGSTLVTAQNTLTTNSGATLSPNLNAGPDVLLSIVDGVAFTLGNPTGSGPSAGFVFHWWIRVRNSSGGAAGTITLDTQYRHDSSFGSPANGQTRIWPVLTINGPIHYIGPCSVDMFS